MKRSIGCAVLTLPEILNCDRLTAVVDVGASPIDGLPPYKALLDAKLCTVMGFEPNEAELAHLNAGKSDLETYAPDAIGYGGYETLRTFAALGLNSLLAPNLEAIGAFAGFPAWFQSGGKEEVKTTRFDDAFAGEMDLLKIDIQGGEMGVFHSGPLLMKSVVAVHTEVSFVPLYQGQPTFGEIDIELRRHGLVPHHFAEIKRWMIAPLHNPGNPFAHQNQLLEADIVYVRDFTKMDAMTNEQMKHLAIIAHYCYGSRDLVVRCLTWLAKRGQISAESPQQYLLGS